MSQILYSCYFSRTRGGEQFVPEHVFSYQIAGSVTMTDGDREYRFGEGSFRLSRRASLLKFYKQPPPGGEYKNVSVFLDQALLRRLSLECGYQARGPGPAAPVLALAPSPLYRGYMDSLQPYEHLNAPGHEALLTLKLREAVLLLLSVNPELQNVLFDFAEPGKLDLEAFMQKNFHFNVDLPRFAYLTGRSLATFKRDFEKIFHLSPSRWLQQRRLQEAHYLIQEQGKTASEVYLDLGFEDLSHFSFAFKKQYGVAPSKIGA